MVEQVEHPGDERVRVGDREPHDDAAVGRCSTTASAPSSSATRAASAPSTSTSTSIGLAAAELPGLAPEGGVDVDVVGQSRGGLAELDRAVDPVDPEGAGLARSRS